MLSRVAKFPAEEHHVSNKVTHLSHVLITCPTSEPVRTGNRHVIFTFSFGAQAELSVAMKVLISTSYQVRK